MSVAVPYSRSEELAHALTAGAGVLACIIGIPWLVMASAGDPWKLTAAVVFGASALAMFATSALYHWSSSPQHKLRYRKMDHAAIYLLIAGTYTPFCLLAMQDPWGWILFSVVWVMATLGIIAKTTVGFGPPRLSTFLYLAMGWLIVLAIQPLRASLSSAEIFWIAAGGLLYTGGVPFYVWKSRRYTHAVWHLFVLGGVVCHFIAVLSVVGAREI